MDFATKHCKALLIMLLLCFSTWSIIAHANPQGGQVTAGSATIKHKGDKTTIKQTSHKAVIDWDTFNIAPHEHTRFQQPSSSAIALNRVNADYGASQILGKLTANGQIWIVNPAGIFFGGNAIVDVAGLVATTANINNQDFMSGNYTFKNVPGWNGAIINQGRIKVKKNGIIALVGPAVINAGVIEAKLGQVALAAGKEFTMDFYGDRLINFGTDSKVTEPVYDQNGQVIKDAVRNSGKILADGGKVLITADAAHAVLDNVINMDGLIDANTIEQKHGEIVIHGGNEGIVNVSGTLHAKGEQEGETGGSIKVLGDKVGIFAGAELNASGMSGGGEILIGGDYKGLGTTPTASATYIDRDTLLDASALQQGNGGKVIVWANDIIRFLGKVNVKGGKKSGNSGFFEVSTLSNPTQVNPTTTETQVDSGTTDNFASISDEITQTGLTIIGGNTTLTTGLNHNITLENINNDFNNMIILHAQDIFIQNVNTIILDNITGVSAGTIVVNNIIDNIYIEALSLFANEANLFDIITESSVQAEIDAIALLNTISSEIHFFDDIDKFPVNGPSHE
jgi:filamentous hemagglutinin family protein